MSLKWTRNQSDSGILRKNDVKEKKEELFVFGYSCKLFRDDEKAQHIDQGKHLIPWMGDETLKIDRYDARGALHNLATLEAPPGGFDWRIELTKNEQDVEQLCDEERYRALHTDEDEEEMYREEELKRLHAAGYGQVGFNYEAPAEPEAAPAEAEDPFVAPPDLIALLPADIVLPETEKLNAIIEKTAKFIASQGAQMEILLRAKQADNPQFQFLSKEYPLHRYYMEMINLVKAGKWPQKVPEEPAIEDKLQENEEYLHPSLGSTIIESAPSIPNLHYRPSADCDYTLLISKMRGEAILDEVFETPPAPGDEAPPGTTPLAPRGPPARPPLHHIARAPVLYSQQTAEQQATEAYYANYAAYYQQYMAAQAQAETSPASSNHTVTNHLAPSNSTVSNKTPPLVNAVKSTGLKLMDCYNTDSDSDDSDSDSSEAPSPPEATRAVIDKMAAYVARNGDAFADIVRAKKDPRFAFLDPQHEYHRWYLRLMRSKRQGNGEGKGKGKQGLAPVSFSIKKLKEPDPVLPKPALPYESSEDEGEKTEENTDEKTEEKTEEVTPPGKVYQVEKTVQLVKAASPVPVLKTEEVAQRTEEVIKKTEDVIKHEIPKPVEHKSFAEVVKTRPSTPMERKRDRDSKRERERTRKKEKRSSKDGRRKHRSPRKEKKKPKEDEIINIEDTEEMIDLTGDLSDTKEKLSDSETERAKQLERRRRAAAFLRSMNATPATAEAAAALPTTSLASAMVDTLESIQKKKREEEEKRRKRDKKRHREKYDNGDLSKRSRRRRHADDDENDDDESKKKKRKKDKKRSKTKRKPSSDDEAPAINIDLSSTLKELRQKSPTRELESMLMGDGRDSNSRSAANDSSTDDDSQVVKPTRRKRKKEDREYSEGEWSSESPGDSSIVKSE